MSIRNMEELNDFLAENSLRPPTPGEVWTFSILEIHAIVAGLEQIKPFMDEGDIEESLMFNKFYEFEQNYQLNRLAEQDELPPGLKLTPTPTDKGFFTAFVATMQFYLWNLPDSIHRVIEEYGAGQEVEFKFGCGHTPIEHENILRDWYEREITEAKKFAATRRAIGMVPPEERITGKPIIARSDLERIVAEHVEKQLSGGLYSPENLEEFIESMVEVGMSREAAEKKASEIREGTTRSTRENLTEKLENKYRVVNDV